MFHQVAGSLPWEPTGSFALSWPVPRLFDGALRLGKAYGGLVPGPFQQYTFPLTHPVASSDRLHHSNPSYHLLLQEPVDDFVLLLDLLLPSIREL
jgi:hypothetical protein